MHADPAVFVRKPLGLAFDIAELLLAQAFAASCGSRLVVETNHHAGNDEFEEVLALYAADRRACRCLIWRSEAAVVVQPMPGRPQRFASLGEALDWLAPEGRVAVTDLTLGTNPGRAFSAPPAEPPDQARTQAVGGGWQLRPSRA
ncbi:MAG TPA: hypothetical protein VFN42_04590 [Acetobacteraceae bacterium]|nr:hypothetical protein [Acetobacteraceae bacterium]